MPSIITEGDMHIGHGTPVSNWHQTAYVATNNNTVFVNGKKVIVVDDLTSCGDPAVVGSSNVFINNKKVHRTGDATGGHNPWVPNMASTGSSNVFAN